MKILKLIATILVLTSTLSFGQTKSVPKNLKQAIISLNIDCPDSLKTIIKQTKDADLKALSYPWGGEYRTIFDWTSGENKNSRIVKYLKKRGITYYQETVILIAFKQFLLGEKIVENAIFKPYQEIERKWAEEDKVRFTADSLRGIYIPINLEDCFTQINSLWSDSIKTVVKQRTEDEFTGKMHFGFGMWMRNNWQLWGGSRLSKYFNSLEIYHPDDMSGIILVSYHRYLNNKDIQLDEQIKYYKDYWANSKKEELERIQAEFAEYKIGDTVLFYYNLGFTSTEQEEKYDEDICISIGKITERNEEKFFLKILLLESCDKKGIIIYDNENSLIYNKKTEKWDSPKKRIIKRIKSGQETWFNYTDWELFY
jgi:hypothetical protein